MNPIQALRDQQHERIQTIIHRCIRARQGFMILPLIEMGATGAESVTAMLLNTEGASIDEVLVAIGRPKIERGLGGYH